MSDKDTTPTAEPESTPKPEDRPATHDGCGCGGCFTKLFKIAAILLVLFVLGALIIEHFEKQEREKRQAYEAKMAPIWEAERKEKLRLESLQRKEQEEAARLYQTRLQDALETAHAAKPAVAAGDLKANWKQYSAYFGKPKSRGYVTDDGDIPIKHSGAVDPPGPRADSDGIYVHDPRTPFYYFEVFDTTTAPFKVIVNGQTCHQIRVVWWASPVKSGPEISSISGTVYQLRGESTTTR